MKTAVRWTRRLLDLALVALVMSVLGLVLAATILPALGHQLIVVRGSSMEPAIPLGSVVEVARVQPSDLRLGDVVTLKEENGTLVSHRITGIVQTPEGLQLRTKGDANGTPDPVLAPASAVVGRDDFSIPGLGYLLYMLTMPAGVISLLCAALTLFLAIWLLEDLEDPGEGEVALQRSGAAAPSRVHG